MKDQPMLIQSLSNLSSLSASLERSPVDRKKRADTLKNRKALLLACQEHDLPALEALIELGAPLNFLNGGSYQNRSLLGICAHGNWVPGLEALVGAGASEQAIEGFFALPEHRSCLQVAAFAQAMEAFVFLFNTHDHEARVKAIAGISKPTFYPALSMLGYADHISQRTLRQMAHACLRSLPIGLANDPAHAPLAAAFDAITAKLAANGDQEIGEALWVAALKGSPELIQALAKRGVPLPADGLVGIIPAAEVYWVNALASWGTMVLAPRTWDANHMNHVYNAEGSSVIRVGLATAALIVSSGHDLSCVYALSAIPALREELCGSALGRHFLARHACAKLLARLARGGFDLLEVATDRGSNPLHLLSERSGTKTDIETFARLCPDWISQRNGDGKTPFDLLPANRQASISVLFDQIGMRSGGVKRGARKKPSSSRRL